jgi:alpha-glucosidase
VIVRCLAACVLAAGALASCAAPGAARAQAPYRAVPASDRWWQEGVVYQVYPRSFQDSNGDGIGDLAGITQRLDYLRDLGVGAIWISPFFPSPMKDFGYDVADYTGVDPMFGTMADFERLVREAHARGIRVLLDFVANHTSDQHAWFRESRASRAGPRRDWYVWRDPAPGGGPPTNWASVFGGSGWTLDSATGQYYFHQFLREQPDLNWRSLGVRRAMYDAMRFWLDRGADGFRLDAFPHMVEDARFRDNPADTSWRPGRGAYDRLRPIHSTNQPETLDVLCDMRRVADAYAARDRQARLLIGEIYAAPRELAAYYGRDGCGAQLPSNFGLLGAPWDAATVHARIADYMAALPAGRWPNWVLGNHDKSRLATRLGPDAARAAAVLLLTIRGTPTIYYGDELGMRDVPIPPELVKDPSELGQPGLGLGRDPERTPMQWTGAPGAGFTTGRPWLPVAADAGRVNVASAGADPTSTLALYRRLLALRRAEPALRAGAFRLLPRQGDVLAYLRQDGEGGRFLVLVNFAAAPGSYALAAGDATTRGARLVAGTHARPADAGAADRVALQANEAVVFRLGRGASSPPAPAGAPRRRATTTP